MGNILVGVSGIQSFQMGVVVGLYTTLLHLLFDYFLLTLQTLLVLLKIVFLPMSLLHM